MKHPVIEPKNPLLRDQTRVTSIPIFFSSRKSAFSMLRSVMTSCIALVGVIKDKLRRPNLLESQTATTRFDT
jgi:hypothetical protein